MGYSKKYYLTKKNLGSSIHDLKQQDPSSDGNNQPSQQQQSIPQRQHDQSKITNGENQKRLERFIHSFHFMKKLN